MHAIIIWYNIHVYTYELCHMNTDIHVRTFTYMHMQGFIQDFLWGREKMGGASTYKGGSCRWSSRGALRRGGSPPQSVFHAFFHHTINMWLLNGKILGWGKASHVVRGGYPWVPHYSLYKTLLRFGLRIGSGSVIVEGVVWVELTYTLWTIQF